MPPKIINKTPKKGVRNIRKIQEDIKPQIEMLSKKPKQNPKNFLRSQFDITTGEISEKKDSINFSTYLERLTRATFDQYLERFKDRGFSQLNEQTLVMRETGEILPEGTIYNKKENWKLYSNWRSQCRKQMGKYFNLNNKLPELPIDYQNQLHKQQIYHHKNIYVNKERNDYVASLTQLLIDEKSDINKNMKNKGNQQKNSSAIQMLTQISEIKTQVEMPNIHSQLSDLNDAQISYNPTINRYSLFADSGAENITFSPPTINDPLENLLVEPFSEEQDILAAPASVTADSIIKEWNFK